MEGARVGSRRSEQSKKKSKHVSRNSKTRKMVHPDKNIASKFVSDVAHKRPTPYSVGVVTAVLGNSRYRVKVGGAEFQAVLRGRVRGFIEVGAGVLVDGTDIMATLSASQVAAVREGKSGAASSSSNMFNRSVARSRSRSQSQSRNRSKSRSKSQSRNRSRSLFSIFG